MDGRANRRVRRPRVRRRLSAVVAPSDVASGRARGAQLRVGGRVLRSEGHRLTLVDALARLDVTLRTGELLPSVGELVVVRGTRSGRRLRDATLVERHPAPEPRGDGELGRLVWQGVGPRLAARADALALIRGHFAREAFVEIDAPQRVSTPGLDLHVEAIGSEHQFLSTSPELQLKRLLVGGLPRIYSLSHCFRAGELGPLHEPEFMLLEWYRAFSGQDAIIDDTETIVSAVVERLTGRPRITLPDGRRIDVRPPFRRLTVRDAFRRHAGIDDAVDLAASDPDRYFRHLVDDVEPALARATAPVFLCDYPISEASLARPCPSDPSVAERFELYLGGVELSNGFGELTDPVEQRRRFESDRRQRRKAKRPVHAIDERFMDALAEGMPPAGGNALGVDRLIALALGLREIAQVLPFPSAWLGRAQGPT